MGSLVIVTIGAIIIAVNLPGKSGSTDASLVQPSVSTPGAGSASTVSPSASPSPSHSPSASASPSASVSRSASKSVDQGASALGPVDPHRANCAPRPSGCGLPDASNTGVPGGTALTVVNGDLTITRAGTVVDRKDIRGCVDVEAPGVTIRRSKISCTGSYVIGNFAGRYSGAGLVVQDVEISCQNTGTGIGDTGLTVVRANIHNCENGFDLDNTITIRDSYIHDLYTTAENHADGIQLNVGGHITITHNTIFAPNSTSAIISNPSGNSDVLVQGNLLAGGAYTLYCPRDRSTNYRVIGNRFGTLFSSKSGEYGPWTDCAKVAVVSGNVWDSTLQALQPD